MPDAPFEQGRPLQAGYNYEWTFVSSPTPTLHLRRKPEHQRKQRNGSNIRPHAILPYAMPPARKVSIHFAGFTFLFLNARLQATRKLAPSRTSPHAAKPATSVVGMSPSAVPCPANVTSQFLNPIVGPELGGSESVPSRNGVQPSPLESPRTVRTSLSTAVVYPQRASQHPRPDAEQLSSIDEDEQSLFGDTRSCSGDRRSPSSDPEGPSDDVGSPYGAVHRSHVSTPQQPSDSRATQTPPVTTGLGDSLEFQLADIQPTTDTSPFSFDPALFPDLFGPSFLATPHDDPITNPTLDALLPPDLQSFLDSWPGLDSNFCPEAHIPSGAAYVWGSQGPISGLYCPHDAISEGLFQSALPSQSSIQGPLHPPVMSLPSQLADYYVHDITN
ncbi:hypothetical protein LXA43DRAFT_1099798 [Ganoderma leucocontextum]|nr:hypothetical protein LXA43DRAFT_1068121 [Ganoderma leucocontextum]KAI1782937.1 hypothetical protein LXA43DRAFT_1103221 [Ganoderma leucocontextum]KAI1785854.1 hypothetical protein LXA43DRAFT_1099798 [Ganoderma leucocontextum]